MISASEERSLDLVQRVVFSAIVMVVTGSIAAVLALYLVYNNDEFSRVDATILWIMTGVVGVITVVVVLLINRRRPLSPWLVLGLLPMAISAYWSSPELHGRATRLTCLALGRPGVTLTDCSKPV